MNTKNYTSFLCKLTILSALAGCNVLSMLTGAKTEINGKDEGDHGPNSSFVFFMDGSDLKALNTKDDSIHSVKSGLGTAPQSVTFFDNHFIFAHDYNLYNYDPIAGIYNSILSRAGSIQAAFNNRDGKLYFIDGPGGAGDLCVINSYNDSSPSCSGSGLDSVQWLMRDFDGNLFACDGTTLSTVSSPETAATIAAVTGSPQCVSDTPLFGGGVFGVIVPSTDIGNYSNHSGLNTVSGTSPNPINMTHDGKLFYTDSTTLNLYDSQTNSSNSIASNYFNGPVHSSPEGEYFFICDDGSDSQVCRFKDGSLEYITGFTMGLTGHYLALGPEGFYYFHSAGIEKVYYDGGTDNIENGSIGPEFFEINEHEMHN